MRFAHLSDLHIAKRVNGFYMLDDQEYILNQILDIIDNENVDGIFISGDIYDKAIPLSEGIGIFDDFLTKLVARNLPIFVISGNHDSSERLNFGSRLFEKNKLFIKTIFDGNMEPIVLNDEFGKLNIYLLPFIKPINVKQCAKYNLSQKSLDELKNYNDSLKIVLENVSVNTDDRNVLLAHQFVTGAISCDSEDVSVGGIDNVGAELFADFDYVALGHIHKRQSIKRDTIRYCGTPLKYSLSEVNDDKTLTIVEFNEKGNLNILERKLTPLRNMRIIEGSLEQIILNSAKDNATDDYVAVLLTDEYEIPDAYRRVNAFYKNLLKLEYKEKKNNLLEKCREDLEITNFNAYELFNNFYEKINDCELNAQQDEFIKDLIQSVLEDNK